MKPAEKKSQQQKYIYINLAFHFMNVVNQRISNKNTLAIAISYSEVEIPWTYK